MKVGSEIAGSKLLAKYGFREGRRVEDRLKKMATLLAEMAKQYKADLVRENLKDLKLNCRRKNRRLNYRLPPFPYHKFVAYIDYKFHERGLNAVEVDAKATSITCPVCRHTDKRNRIGKEEFKCRRCGFTFNAQYVACLNLSSRL